MRCVKASLSFCNSTDFTLIKMVGYGDGHEFSKRKWNPMASSLVGVILRVVLSRFVYFQTGDAKVSTPTKVSSLRCKHSIGSVLLLLLMMSISQVGGSCIKPHFPLSQVHSVVGKSKGEGVQTWHRAHIFTNKTGAPHRSLPSWHTHSLKLSYLDICRCYYTIIPIICYNSE